MLEELVAPSHCTHILIKVAIKYVYTYNTLLVGFFPLDGVCLKRSGPKRPSTVNLTAPEFFLRCYHMS